MTQSIDSDVSAQYRTLEADAGTMPANDSTIEIIALYKECKTRATNAHRLEEDRARAECDRVYATAKKRLESAEDGWQEKYNDAAREAERAYKVVYVPAREAQKQAQSQAADRCQQAIDEATSQAFSFDPSIRFLNQLPVPVKEALDYAITTSKKVRDEAVQKADDDFEAAVRGARDIRDQAVASASAAMDTGLEPARAAFNEEFEAARRQRNERLHEADERWQRALDARVELWTRYWTIVSATKNGLEALLKTS